MCMLRLCLLYSIKDHQEKTTDLCAERAEHPSQRLPVLSALLDVLEPLPCISAVTHIYTRAVIAAFQVSDKAALEKQIRSGRCTLGPKNH